MKCADIIKQLMTYLPIYSDLFSTKISIATVTRSGIQTAVITTTAPHGLINGEPILTQNIPVTVQIISGIVNGNEIEFKTNVDHDLTLNKQDSEKFVTIKNGSSNQIYKLLEVPNRFTFIVLKESQPTIIIPAYLENVYPWGYNVLAPVTVIDANTFSYPMNFPVGGDVQPNDLVLAKLNTKLRISGSVDLQTILNSYTKQPTDNIWAYVVLEDFTANKEKNNSNDAYSTQGRRGDFYQQIISSFNVYIFVPNKGAALTDTNGRIARDVIEDIRLPLFKSLLGKSFSTGLTEVTQAVCTYAGDGYKAYNGAYYVHEFKFEQTVSITAQDTNRDQDVERAFRDIDVKFTNENSTTSYYLGVNLDDVPEVPPEGFGAYFGLF